MFEDIKVCNMLLYLRYNGGYVDACNNRDIFCFNNNKIIAIDEFRFNQEQRISLQDKLKIRPYYISQRIFQEFLYEICFNKPSMFIKDIKFIDNSISDTTEYEDLVESINNRDYISAYKSTNDIINDFNTGIKLIRINYEGYDFNITSKGIISAHAPLQTINNLFHDNKFNRMILGIR